jgi:spore coat protein A
MYREGGDMKRSFDTRRLGGGVFVTVLLTAGAVGWWRVSPSAESGGKGSAGQLAVTASLTLLLAGLAVAGGWWVASQQRETTPGWQRLLPRAGVTAGLFALLVLATTPVHQAIQDRLAPTAGPNLAAIQYDVSCPPSANADQCREFERELGGFDGTRVADSHQGMLHHTGHSPEAHAAMMTETGGAGAAVQDALLVLVVSLPVAWLALALVARWQPAAESGRRARPVRSAARVPRRSSRWAAVAAIATLVAAGNFVFAPVATAQAVPPPFSVPMPIPPVLTGSNITITMAETQEQLLPDGPATTMWTYNGTFPGPTIRRPSGSTTEVTFVNNLPVTAGEATVHNHGNHSAPSEDGQPDDFLIPPGGQRTYTWEHVEDGAPEWAAPQWYHDHRMDVTGRNVWNGLVGMYILDDAVEAALPLPDGAFDVPLVVADRTFNADNQIPYTFNLGGVTGNTVLVNGAPQPFFEVGDRKYRFRVLNASNFRTYNLTLSNGAPITQIGTESGLLPAPITQTAIRILPAERVDIVVDFAGQLGQNIVLQNTEVGAGTTAQVMQFRVTQDVTDDSQVPATLRPARTFPTPSVERDFELGLDGGVWTINGLPFDANRIDAEPVLGSTERWHFCNTSPLEHALHIHDVDWRIESRFQCTVDASGQVVVGNPLPVPAREDAMKETWSIRPGQGLAVTTRFTDHTGVYVFHCHMLEHEDLAMMTQFEVQPS